MKNFISKSFKSLLALAMAFSIVTPMAMQESKAATTDASVEVSGKEVTIGNSFMSRTFDITDFALTTTKISNFRTDGVMELVPQAGSEEFVIELMAKAVALEAINRTNWQVSTTSEYTGDSTGVEGPATNLIDGNLNTIWHTAYANNRPVSALPHSVIFKLDGAKQISCFSYTPRQNGESTNGNVNQYELWISNSDSATPLANDDSSWEKVASGTFNYNGVAPIYVNLPETKTATQVKFVAVSEKGTGGFGAGAEFNLHEGFYTTSNSSTIATSAMLLDETTPYEINDVTETINGVEKTGVELRFNFRPHTVGDVVYTIEEVITMYDGDSFMRKHLDISVPQNKAAYANISYIDVESMILDNADLATGTYWTIPEQANNPDMGNMKGDYLELGQPYYVDAFYVGSEFPMAENKIRDQKAFSRYWYGKSLAKDPHFDYNLNNTSGEMQTWDVVTGAARSTDYLVCQADFYEYIETIATKTDFRQQYNSWYDHMKNISSEIIKESFYEIEKGFTQHGVEPLDSYVVDDGWTNWNSFWGFNDKFPNELYDASLQVNQMGSNFGLWVGPRGGYGTEYTISRWIANNGMGSINNSSNDINIGDARYCNTLVNDIFVGYQNKFDINYWKLDGMMLNAPTTPSEYYVTGNAFYTFSETYERWTDMFEIMRASGDEDLWINLTSYLNPSPWFTQWVNSVWMQNTGDCGYTRTWSSNDASAALTYRDDCYYKFINDRQWQLPNKYFYNHDPVYGLSALNAYGGGTINFSTDQLREYLYMLGTRGTAFWEYYYSYKLFDDEKWDVNAEAANWIESNFDVLQKSKMFGGKPGNGEVYGFSCWKGHEGIVSIRNPKNVQQTITVTYDRLIGVAEDMEDVSLDVVLGDIRHQNDSTLSYGDQVTYTLGAEEVLILHFGEKDTTAPEIEFVEATAANKVEVRFNEQIRNENLTAINVAGNTVTAASLKADKRTVELTLANDLTNKQEIEVSTTTVKDITGNVADTAMSNDYFEGGVAFNKEALTFNGNAITVEAEDSISGNGGFTISGTIKTTSTNATIVKQEGAYEVAIDEEGYLTFDVKGLSTNSKYTEKLIVDGEVVSTVKGKIADGLEHQFSAVKEVNGMIKLYIDGLVVASAYDENNANPMIEKAPVTIGNQLLGSADYISLNDAALAYDNVAELYEDADIDGVTTPIESTNFTASANVSTGEGDIANIWDGDPTTFWASPETTTTVEKGNPAVTVDLGATYVLNQVDYTKRYFNGEQNQWKCTGNIRNYVLEVSTDGTNWTTVREGATFDDEGYTSKGDGGTTAITFAPTVAKYIRISATATYHWKDGVAQPENLLNTIMTIGDLKVYGEKATEENLALNKPVNAYFVSDKAGAAKDGTTTGAASDRPLSMAVDGTKNDLSNNYGEFGVDNRAEGAYLEIDLQSVCEITGINLWRYWKDGRTYEKTVVAVSENADFSNPTIIYNTDFTDEYGFGVGEDQEYAETSSGHPFTVPAGTKGQYVRLYMHGAYKGAWSGNTNHVNEIEVMGNKATSVNVTALKEAIATAKATDTTGKTTASIEALNNAVAAGEAQLINAFATQLSVDAAKDAILTAIENLTDKEIVDFTVLTDAIATAKATDTTGKTAASIEALNSAVAAGEALVGTETTQAAINEAAKAITDAIANLEDEVVEPEVDKTQLVAAIEAAKAIDAELYEYDSRVALTNAIAAAEAVNAKEDATQEEVNEAVTALTETIANLKLLPIDKELLSERLEQAKAVDVNKYTEESVLVLASAITAAQTVFDNADATQKEVDQAVQMLDDALGKLNLKPVDKSGLETMLADAKAIDASLYTEESYAVLADAITAAEAVIANDSATQEQVTEAKAALTQAVAGLQEKPQEPQGPTLGTLIEGVTVLGFSSECDTNMEGSGLGSAEASIDEDPNTHWHSNWQTNNGETHWLSYDLGARYDVSDFDFLPRQNGDYVNGDIFEFKVYVSEDETFDENDVVGNFAFLHEGFMLVSRDYQVGEFAEVATGRYVKVEVVHSGGDTGNDQFASMAEIRFYGEEASETPSEPVNKDGLISMVNDAKAQDASKYTEESFAVLAEAIAAAEAVIADEKATKEDVSAAKQALIAAVMGLQEKPAEPVNKDGLISMVNDAKLQDASKYTEESFAVLADAIAAAEAVIADENATKEDVSAAKQALIAAVMGLQEKPAAPVVDKAALVAAIEAAKAIDASKYTDETVAVLASAITAAEAVNEKADATQAEVDAAVKAIEDAKTALKAKEEPTPEPKPVMDFYDVQDKAAWFYGSVEKAFEKGLMGATGKAPVNGKPFFEPDTNISRGMVATVLYRMAGMPKVTYAGKFPDVANNLWYTNAIEWAAANGVVSGYKDGTFGPDANITRQDLAIMLRNYATKAGLATTADVNFDAFKDGKDVDSYAASAVAWCVEAGLMSGANKADGKYLNPKANATRAECAKMFALLDDAIIANNK